LSSAAAEGDELVLSALLPCRWLRPTLSTDEPGAAIFNIQARVIPPQAHTAIFTPDLPLSNG